MLYSRDVQKEYEESLSQCINNTVINYYNHLYQRVPLSGRDAFCDETDFYWDVYERLMNEITSSKCNKTLIKIPKQCKQYYSIGKRRNNKYNKGLNTLSFNHLNGEKYILERQKRQTTSDNNERKGGGVIPVQFLTSVAHHLQMSEIVFVIDLIDLKGNRRTKNLCFLLICK